jgi:hypothetical protein
MEEYYINWPLPATPKPALPVAEDDDLDVNISDYNRQCVTDLSDDLEEGWASELRWYLGVVHRNVTKDADLVNWWQVSNIFLHIFTCN